MFKKYFLIFALATLTGGVPSVAKAEISEQELRLMALEEKQQANAQLLEILKRITWYGDFRTRYQSESTQISATDISERDRGRIRFRLGATVHMLKDLDIGFRLSTGDAQRDSGNETLDGGFTNKDIDLNMAFFRYTPDVAGLETTWQGGKFKPPFMKSEIIWDDDVTVEGISEQFSHKFGDTKLEANFGQFIYDEFDSTGADIVILGYQGVLSQQTVFGKFKFAVGYYDVQNVEDARSAPTGTTLLSNTSEVKMLDIMGEWSEKIAGKKLKLFGEYTQNVGDLATGNPDLDTAWQVGAKYGKSGKKFGDYDLKVTYRLVQTEAVFDVISDSDFHGSRSNARGFEAGGSLGLAKGVKLGITYFDTEEERGTQWERETLQVDLKFKF